MVEWPEPYTISQKARELKRRFVESFTSEEGEDEKVRDLNYIVAVSSGKAVTEEIPSQIGRRAGWASQQGANFVELLIENPAQLMMDSDMLINLADQLNLHYNIHSSTSMAYGMSYRRGRGNGFDASHEYTVKLLKAIKRFRGDLENRGLEMDENGHPRLYAINGHMAIAQVPAEEERLAQDVSVDPFGEPIEEGEIFESQKAREQIWEGYIRPEILEVEDRVRRSVIQELDLAGDFQDEQRNKVLERLIDRGYLPPREELDEYNQIRGYDELNLENIRSFAQTDIPQIPPEEDIEPDYPRISREEMRSIESKAQEDAEERTYELAREAVVEDEEAVKNMRDVVGLRSIRDEMWKESTIFRHIIPRWMPHSQHPQIVQMWENITEKTTKDIDELEAFYEKAFDDPRKEEDVIASATGAYVWGHFTQEVEGYDQSLMAYLEDAGMYWSFESHMAGPAENARIWKPKDMIEVVKAINETPVRYENEEGETVEEPVDRTRITIDMEHIASQKVDPMWVIDPDEETQKKENYKGLDEGDGEYIMINHVTHPYITEEGHQHGPVRRGDTRVYRYIHKLVEKGMTKDEKLPTVVMYEIGTEKDETLYMLRLILNMIEHGIEPEQLEGEGAARIINKDEPEGLEEYLIKKFFGVTDTEVQHEWQEIHQHALDPLEDLLEAPEGGYTWMGEVATERGIRPEDWEGEEYR